MALQDYARLFLLVDSLLQVQIESIQIATDAGNIEINTFDGLAGFSPGPGKVQVTVNYAIPLGGFEFNFQAAVCDRQVHAIQIGVGPHALVSEGKFMTDNISGSTTSATIGSVTFHGRLAKFEASI